MATGTGLDASIGFAEESAFNVYTPPIRWLLWDSEGLQFNLNRVTSNAIGGGALYPSDLLTKVTTHDGGGAITMPFVTAGMGLLLKHCFGTNALAANTPVAGASTMTFSPGGMAGKSLTIQKAVPTSASPYTVEPITYTGAKVTDVEFSMDVATGMLMVTFTFDAVEEYTLNDDPTKTLVTPTVPAARIFSFKEGAITLGGSPVASVRTWSLKHAIARKTDRYYIGGGGSKNEQLENAKRSLTGALTAEFTSRAALYDAYKASTSLAMVTTFTGGVAPIAGSTYPSVSFSTPAIKLNGATPKVAGPDVVPIACTYDGFNSNAVTVTVVTADSAY